MVSDRSGDGTTLCEMRAYLSVADVPISPTLLALVSCIRVVSYVDKIRLANPPMLSLFWI